MPGKPPIVDGRISRRGLLTGTAGAAGLLVARPLVGPAGAAINDFGGTARSSRLFPGSGQFAVHSDLHNHTLLSDGRIPAEDAYVQMRASGLDVASLTDHAVMGKTHGDVTCHDLVNSSRPDAETSSCSPYVGINEARWQQLAEISDANDGPDEFVAMRGFEWTTGSLGHLNVWFSEQWIDALQTGSLSEVRDLDTLSEEVAGVVFPPELADVVNGLPSTASIDGFYDWLTAEPGSLPLGGGADGLAGFNHPNEFGNFNEFQFFPEALGQIVSCEVFNGPAHPDLPTYDYWFFGVAQGQAWPINACLNQGWRVGLIGVSDNHQDHAGLPGHGRGGLWVASLTREGIREALAARRMYATTVPGLRLDAAANGGRMGTTVGHAGGPVEFVVDLDLGASRWGDRVVVEVAGSGPDEPRQLHVEELTLARPDEPLRRFTVDIDPGQTPWALLRITDPAAPLDVNAVAGPWTEHGGAIAYSSPFWFDPTAPPPPPLTEGAQQPATGPSLPATGGGVGVAALAVAAAAAVRLRQGPGPADRLGG